jgi:hypothetical protein
VVFIPRKSHVLQLVGTLSAAAKSETVEALLAGYRYHTILKCSATGIILDTSIGQFIGSMAPIVFQDINAFTSVLPRQIIHVFPCSKDALQRHIAQDSALTKTLVSPDLTPPRFAQRVLRSLREKEHYCWKCFGTASQAGNKALMRCSNCKQALYC